MNENAYSTTLMDFPDNDIFIITESVYEKGYRAHACAKEPITVQWIREFAHKGVFYDIGANVGSYSLIAASLMSDENVVVAFEPVFFNFYRLNENILINRFSNKIIPMNIGLTNKNAIETVYLNNLDFGVTARAGGDVKKNLFTKALCLTLDSIIQTGTLPFPEHIKIDVDGDELAVLEGGAETFSDSRLKSLMIEIDESDVEQSTKTHEILINSGFKLYDKKQLMSRNLFNTLFIKE